MTALIVFGLIALLLWGLVGRRLTELGVSGPLVIVVLGAVAGLFFGQDLPSVVGGPIAEKVVEIILAILLFVDAIEVRRGFLGGEARLVTRLLAIALPMSLLAAFLVGKLMFPEVSWAAALVIACIVMPTDFAAAAHILRDRRLPDRIRHVINVESGYNDGIVSPLFVFALAAAVGTEGKADFFATIEAAVMPSVWAVVVGAVVGGAAGLAVRHALKAGWVTEQSLRIGILVIPLLAYVLCIPLNGNGFVAAFVAGIAFRISRTNRSARDDALDHGEILAADDFGVFTSYGLWFVFGAMAVQIFDVGVGLRVIVFGVLALIVLRMVPVYLSLLGSSTSWRERTVIGLAGPRGTASIVFGLLAYSAMGDLEAEPAIKITMVVVLGSVILHGALAPRIAASLIGSRNRESMIADGH